MIKKRLATSPPPALAELAVDALYQDIKQLVEQARAQVLVQVNQALVLTYWHIGKTIKQTVVTEARADYGDATMQKLADRLVLDFGPGFGRRNLFRMVKLYQCFDSLEIVTTLSTQLSWSHLVELLKVEEATRRSFYAELCAQSRWSVRTLRERMDSLTWKPPSWPSWSASSSSLAVTSPSWAARSASRSAGTTTTSTCCSSTAGCAAWCSSS